MALADLYNVPVSQTDLLHWSFVHAAHHYDIVRVIQEQKNLTLSTFILDPFDPNSDSFDTWLYNHQSMHDQMEAVLRLNVSNFDLSTVDWQDAQALQFWINFNALAHVQAGAILGLG